MPAARLRVGWGVGGWPAVWGWGVGWPAPGVRAQEHSVPRPRRARRKWLAPERAPLALAERACASAHARGGGVCRAFASVSAPPPHRESDSRHLAPPPSHLFPFYTLSPPPRPFPSVSRAAAAETAPSLSPHSPRGTRRRAYKCS